MIFMGVGVVFTVPVRCFFFHSELPLNEDVRVLYHGEIASVNGGCEISLKKNKFINFKLFKNKAFIAFLCSFVLGAIIVVPNIIDGRGIYHLIADFNVQQIPFNKIITH